MSIEKLNAAILVVSDTAACDHSLDKSGKLLQDVFREEGGGRRWEVPQIKIVPDSVLEIQRTVTQWTDTDQYVNFIVTSGGTGFSAKDNTPEAISPLLHKHASGLVKSWYAGGVSRPYILYVPKSLILHMPVAISLRPVALMSRPVAGVRNKTLIITVPGSPKGAKENLQAVIKLLPHACLQAAGADSRALHAGGVEKLEEEAGLKPGAMSVIDGDKHSHHHHHHHCHGHSHGGHATPVAHTDPESRPVSNDPHEGPTQRHRSSPYPMVSVNQAQQLIRQHTPTPEVIKAAVNEDVVGSVLAEDVRAVESVPAFRASIVDGYALVVNKNTPSAKGVFSVAFSSHASPGEVPTLQPGQIARITTGAPLPPGATSVVMVEDTRLKTLTDDGKEENEVEILTEEVQPGENVREVGSDVKAGDVIMRKGEGISAIGGEFGLLASVGVKEVFIYRRPVVGVLSTGDEIVPHDRPGELRLGEVRDTNRPTLLTAVRGSGFEAVDLGIASDKSGALEQTFRNALRRTDVIITSGGVSMGELDLLKPTIERCLGGTLHFGRVAMKPGKPTTFATVPYKNNAGERKTKSIFSLPGNPASAVVTFHLFVLPSLHQAAGISRAGLPKVMVVLEQEVKLDPRPEYHRVVVTAKKDGLLYASSTGMQRSSRIGSFKAANALLCLPAGKGMVERGAKVEALLMGKIVSDFT